MTTIDRPTDHHTDDTTDDTTDATTDATSIDPGELERFVGQVATDCATAMHAASVSLGDKLGLWTALAQRPATPTELAHRTGLDARYLDDWLKAQYVSGYAGHDATTGRFSLSAEQAAVLADPSAPTYLAGAATLAGVLHRDDALAIEAFRTGRGIGWHEHHGDLFSGTERLFRPAYAANLVDAWIPALDGVEARLRAGGKVADVGCGFGASTILLAQAFPACTIVGFDYHEASIEAARDRAAAAGVADRATFEVATASDFPGAGYDLICIFDALHDMGDPVGAARHIKGALASTGTFMFVEPMAGETLDDNVNIVGRMFYSVAPFVCTAHARSQHGPHELGNQVPDSTWDALTREAGFSRFRRACETPFNRIYEVRP
jgi:SAM-dependent methyltransferase